MPTTKTPGRYARILLDYWFKRSFGMEGRQRLLTLFLQELIPERKIVSLSYAPQEHISLFPDDKGIRVDVECTDEDGTRFVVEMQLSEQKFFYERAVFNSTFAIQEQMVSGQSSYDFPAVYFIGIMDFSMHEDSDQVLYRYQLRERDSFELMTDRIQYLFLELTNARHALEPDSTILEKFCYALHNMEHLPGRPEGFEGELFRLLFDSAEIATFTPQEKIKYEFDMTTERDIRNQIAFAEEKGIAKGMEKGMEKGREEGREEERQRILEALRSQGVPEDILAKAIPAPEEQ
ncbi:MAG: Rpn family recombination-promoting nuclease/putative transposase [Bacteroidales bacterium]|nr:Rpn family recombination-promoting nuclease/putative transposase [Bacteroidales bacterium]